MIDVRRRCLYTLNTLHRECELAESQIDTHTENEVSFNVKRAAHCHAPEEAGPFNYYYYY
jgi:hypothetical protein